MINDKMEMAPEVICIIESFTRESIEAKNSSWLVLSTFANIGGCNFQYVNL